MVCSVFFNFFSFNLRNHIFQSAKKYKMTSFCMTSLHVHLNEAAKCVAIISPTLLAPLWHLRKIVQKQNGDDVWPNLRRLMVDLTKVRGMTTWKELMTGVKQLVRLLFKNNFINPGLVL